MRYVLKCSSGDSVLIHHGIKGMKWGRRRYQNEDGSLTDAGRKRYSNSDSKSDSDGKSSDANSPKISNDVLEELTKTKLDKELKDMGSAKNVASSASALANASSNAVRQLYNPKIPKMNLSELSNKEMQERIQREALERQYDQMFNVKRQRVEAGKARVTNALATAGTVLAVGSAAIELATAIKKWRR